MYDRCKVQPASTCVQLTDYNLLNNVEDNRVKELSDPQAQKKISELQFALEREQAKAREQVQEIEEMAEREKQRILKHLEDEKRFTRDIIVKSETMIEQLKRELSSERKRKTTEQKTRDALRDIYKKITPNQGKNSSKSNKIEFNNKNDDGDGDDDDDDSPVDGETTVCHRDDPLLSSTPRDRSLLVGRSSSLDSHTLRRQLEDDHDESLLHEHKSKATFYSCLPPTPKRRVNAKNNSNDLSTSFEKGPKAIIKIDPASKSGGNLNIQLLT